MSNELVEMICEFFVNIFRCDICLSVQNDLQTKIAFPLLLILGVQNMKKKTDMGIMDCESLQIYH